MKLAEMTACRLRELLSNGDTSCVDIMDSVLNEIDSREAKVHAFISVRDRDVLLAEARNVDERRRRGDPVGVLSGLPVAIKDNICTSGLATTCASRMLSNFIPPYDATVVTRIRAADGIVLGKTNMDEFAMGSSTETSAFGVTRNPRNPDYVPGGTSGGSAAAVAANETILAIGSDTGGSIRQPAAFCGVVGMKPTYGSVSRLGLIPYASSLDQVGVFGKDIADAALLLSVIIGHDPLDSTSLKTQQPICLPEFKSAERLRIGVPSEYFGDGLDREIRRAVTRAIDLMTSDGHSTFAVNLQHTPYALPTYYITASAEASSNLAKFDGCQYGFRATQYNGLIDMMCQTRTEGFGPEVKRRIMLGTYVLSAGYYDAFYLKAARVRKLIHDELSRSFETADILVHPITPTPPFRIGEKIEDPLVMYLSDVYSVVANLAGLPAISIPCGWTSEGLPIGIQLLAKWQDESRLFRVARRLEELLADMCASESPGRWAG